MSRRGTCALQLAAGGEQRQKHGRRRRSRQREPHLPVVLQDSRLQNYCFKIGFYKQHSLSQNLGNQEEKK